MDEVYIYIFCIFVFVKEFGYCFASMFFKLTVFIGLLQSGEDAIVPPPPPLPM